MDFKHEIIGLKDQGDKNDVDENVSNYGKLCDIKSRMRDVTKRGCRPSNDNASSSYRHHTDKKPTTDKALCIYCWNK